MRNEHLAVLIKKLKGRQVSTRRNLDQLCKPVADLRNRESAKEREVQERLRRRMERSETILTVGVVDCNLDADGGVDQANERGRNADEGSVAAVGGTGEANRLSELS